MPLLKRKWKFRAWCIECEKVKLFKRTPSGVWVDDKGHEWDWNRDIISEMEKWRRKKEKLEKRRKKKDHLKEMLKSMKNVR